ncbi:unnamed protein product [Sphagnum tenellum]
MAAAATATAASDDAAAGGSQTRPNADLKDDECAFTAVLTIRNITRRMMSWAPSQSKTAPINTRDGFEFELSHASEKPDMSIVLMNC